MQQQIKINMMGVFQSTQFLPLFVSNWTPTRVNGFSMQAAEKMESSFLSFSCSTVCKPQDMEVNQLKINFIISM
jgi:hypothetical protein